MRIDIEQDGVVVEAELRDGTFSLGSGARDHVRVSAVPPSSLRLSVAEGRLIVSSSRGLTIGGAPLAARVPRLVLPGEWIHLSRSVRVRRGADEGAGPSATQAVMRELLGVGEAPAEAVAGPELVGLTGLDLGRTFALVDGPNRLGRGDQVPIRIRDRSVSREHAELTWTPDGAFLADLGTANGTFVNGRRLSRGTRLRPGDVVEVGRTMLKAVLPEVAERPGPPPPPGSPEAVAQQPTQVKPPEALQRRSRRQEWTVVGLGLATAAIGLALSCGLVR